MRRQTRRRALGAGFIGLLVITLALTRCAGRRDGPLPSTAVVPTVVATLQGRGTRIAATATTKVVATTAVPVATAAPTVMYTPAATSVEPRVIISPTNGPVGTQFRVVATGFRPETMVTLGMGRHGGKIETTITTQSDAQGQALFHLVIPDSAEVGDLWLVVAQILGQPVQAVSNLFEVTAPRSTQSVQVDPQSAAPGDMLTITGSGFPSETQVEIGFGLPDTEPALLRVAQTHADGRVEVTVEVPASAAPEAEWIVTIATLDQAITGVSDPVAILAAPEPTAARPAATPAPTEAVSTEPVPTATAASPATRAPIVTPEPPTGPSVRLYLIALDDAGQSGPQIGCGDSVVAVAVSIEPTMGVLRAAMERLVSLEGPDYGNTGLHNALHRSELTVGAIGIAAGHATIHLSGTLSVDGACDAPRVQAQLEQTALQFATVDRVTILVNGQPLASVLSQQ
jgi:hypothetical protein